MIAPFSITPVGVGESVSELVAGCVGIVKASGLPNETNVMFTNVEGDWDDAMRVIKQCVDHVAMAASRVSVVVDIDHRPGVSGALRSKVESVEQRLSSMCPAHGPDRGGHDVEASRSKRWFAGVSRSAVRRNGLGQWVRGRAVVGADPGAPVRG